MSYTEWEKHGACVGTPTDLWFPAKTEQDKIVAAKRICFGCPVREECLEDALVRFNRHGIRGGTSEKERKVMRRQRRAAAA